MLFEIFAIAVPLLQSMSPQVMSGAWAVDLSTDPAAPYVKSMQLTLEPDGQLSGEFYDSVIQAGRWKTQAGRLCVSFRTSDGVGPYHTTGCLVGDEIQGQTWAEHRNFVFIWSATRPSSSE